jgi:uncharacterized protein (UPF0262 family)
MIWKLNNAGNHESSTHIIEHLPSRNTAKPYYLYVKTGKQGWLNFMSNYATIDIAKRAATHNDSLV